MVKTKSNWWNKIEIDNGAWTVHIPTPKGWKCKKKGCKTGFKHTHSTYNCLKKIV